MENRRSHLAKGVLLYTPTLLVALTLTCLLSSCQQSPAHKLRALKRPSPTARVQNPEVPIPPCPEAPSPCYPDGAVDLRAGRVAKVFAKPTFRSAVVKTIADGAIIQVRCTSHGELVSDDSGGKSDIWDKTIYGYLPAVDVFIPSYQPATVKC
jgi:hypothetical protein